MFLAIDDDIKRIGAITPKGKKEGTLWDVGEATKHTMTVPNMNIKQEVTRDVTEKEAPAYY